MWFRASIGRQKNAEARWLLPMICRRGGIDKHDIGAIRIYGAHTEFEISGQAAEFFSAKIKRPDTEENIRIEQLPNGPQGEAASGQHAGKPAERAHEGKPHEGRAARHNDKPRHERAPSLIATLRAAARRNSRASRDRTRSRGTNTSRRMPARPPRDHARPFAKPAFGKKPKKKKYRG